MNAAARKLAQAMRRAAEREHERRGPGRHTATVTRWDGENDFDVDLHGVDFDLTGADITLSQTVRAYAETPGIDPGDELALIEVDDEYVAIAVQSNADTPTVATAAELAAHAATKTGVHGIPAMLAGQGIVWTGSGWAATDLATEAEMGAAIAAALSGRMTASQLSTLNAGVLRKVGAVANLSEQFTAATTARDGAGAADSVAGGANIELSFTPAVNCFWELDATAILHCDTAANHRCDAAIQVSTGTTADGYVAGSAHSTVNNSADASFFNGVRPRARFKLNGGVAYTARLVFAPAGGTWRYYRSGDRLHLESKVVGFW